MRYISSSNSHEMSYLIKLRRALGVFALPHAGIVLLANKNTRFFSLLFCYGKQLKSCLYSWSELPVSKERKKNPPYPRSGQYSLRQRYSDGAFVDFLRNYTRYLGVVECIMNML